jgi:hypothetical protein
MLVFLVLQLAPIRWLGIQIPNACFHPEDGTVSAQYGEDIQVIF